MLLAILMFLIGAGTVLGAYAAVTKLPAVLAQRKLDRRLSEVTMGIGGPGEAESDETVVKQHKYGPLPVLDKLVERTNAGGRLQQSDRTVRRQDHAGRRRAHLAGHGTRGRSHRRGW